MANLERTVATSAANTLQTVSTTGSGHRRIGFVTVAYSAAPTYAANALYVLLNSGAGAGYDCRLYQQGTANTQFTTFIPSQPIYINGDDQIDVVAPAGGVGVTSAVAIYTDYGA